MANKLYSENAVQNIADAIRQKNGLTTEYKISEMAQAVLDLPSGGEDLTKGLIEHTLSSITKSDIQIISTLAFAYNTGLRYVEFENCNSIGKSAF